MNQRNCGDYLSKTTHEQDVLVSRIERLEEQNRRLKRGGVVCLLAIASIGLMGQTTQHKSTHAAAPAPAPAPVMPKNIEAESFVLKDTSGRVRAELSMDGTGPSFRLRDQSGSALVTLSLNDAAPGGPILLLSDPQHGAGLSMSVLEGAGSQLSLTGTRAGSQAHIGVTTDGTSLELFDQEGFSTDIGNGAQVSKGGQLKKTSAASIMLFNKDRKLLWSTP
jgi:hypothetical protein